MLEKDSQKYYWESWGFMGRGGFNTDFIVGLIWSWSYWKSFNLNQLLLVDLFFITQKKIMCYI